MQRPASSRNVMQEPDTFDFTSIPQNTDFTNYNFDPQYQDPSLLDPNAYAQNSNPAQAPTYGSSLAPVPSTDLVRRSRNQQLTAQSAQQEAWNGYAGASGGDMARQDEEDEKELEMRVASAKKDAQGKRKQIPPFVQKLSSFLDSGNTDLIRWADDGRSFIVIDEDEFARTLIPELFKHNNYASFVRQLNMYGFHKTVNITDGSLRQSEKARKGVKPPSMYSHPYFRRNRPDLLWLIQKPMTKAGVKRKRDGTAKGDESDDDARGSPDVEGRLAAELKLSSSAGGGRDLAPLPRSELASVRRELADLKTSQRQISDMIQQLQRQNEMFYEQTSAFQALHNRHETSINAILTFLATFYNRSLEDHAGQNLMDMFNQQNKQQQQGSVVEDYSETSPEGNNQQVQRYQKRPLLLHAPTNPGLSPASPIPPGVVHTAPTSSRSSLSPPGRAANQSGAPRRESTQSVSQGGATDSPRLKNDAPTPDLLSTVPESDQMMSLINSVNATNASTPGFTAPSLDFANASNAPLTAQQRDDMLALISQQQQQPGASSNNALVSPSMPDLNMLKQQQDQLALLTSMQRAQDERVSELNRRLQPLSPTGTIPGLGENGGFFDPNAFINYDDNDLNFDFGADPGGAVDWEFGEGGDGSGVPSVEEAETPGSGGKRQKRG
nr:hypothetical protein B0A51_06053 [Rachicladosporium sp. CCFEE 5018]